ncbi:hypothetical protein D3H54_29640 [Mycobacterium sp. ELW1]|nr:hypothetical protein D3H54_29640 [Mycobacterium sp. ELW1]
MLSGRQRVVGRPHQSDLALDFRLLGLQISSHRRGGVGGRFGGGRGFGGSCRGNGGLSLGVAELL